MMYYHQDPLVWDEAKAFFETIYVPHVSSIRGKLLSVSSFGDDVKDISLIVGGEETVENMLKRFVKANSGDTIAIRLALFRTLDELKEAEPGVDHRVPRKTLEDITGVVVLAAEIDQSPHTAEMRVVRILGKPTLAVRSGGTTEDGQAKIHLYWRLRTPALTQEEIAKVRTAQRLLTLIGAKGLGENGSDGDTSFTSVHPIRLPGSWNCKYGDPVLCSIRDSDETIDVDLDDALSALKKAAVEMGIRTEGEAGKKKSFN